MYILAFDMCIHTHTHTHTHIYIYTHTMVSVFFSVVTYRCVSWTIMKAEHQRTDALEVWCWRKLFRVS